MIDACHECRMVWVDASELTSMAQEWPLHTRNPFSSPLSSTGMRKHRLTRTATRTVDEGQGMNQVPACREWAKKQIKKRAPNNAVHGRLASPPP
jgi:Zn-finger nucleic acid-binding protein